MTEKSKKSERIELGLNPISIEFPYEPFQNIYRPNHKHPFRMDTRPQSANSTAIIHSVPQYWANVGTSKKGFLTSNNYNPVKIDRPFRVREEKLNNNKELAKSPWILRQMVCMSAETLKVKSMKIGELNLNKKLEENKETETGITNGITGNNGVYKETETKLRSFLSKPEIKMKKSLIEIGRIGLKKDRKVVKGKIFKNNLTFRSLREYSKNVGDLMIINSKR